jgi:hypothetical protein
LELLPFQKSLIPLLVFPLIQCCSPLAVTEGRSSALHYASSSGHSAIVRLLVTHADGAARRCLALRDSAGASPLAYFPLADGACCVARARRLLSRVCSASSGVARAPRGPQWRRPRTRLGAALALRRYALALASGSLLSLTSPLRVARRAARLQRRRDARCASCRVARTRPRTALAACTRAPARGVRLLLALTPSRCRTRLRGSTWATCPRSKVAPCCSGCTPMRLHSLTCAGTPSARYSSSRCAYSCESSSYTVPCALSRSRLAL